MEPSHRWLDWLKLCLGPFTVALGLLNDGCEVIGIPIAVIPGSWLALEGAADTVPRGWRRISAALRIGGGAALIAV